MGIYEGKWISREKPFKLILEEYVQEMYASKYSHI